MEHNSITRCDEAIGLVEDGVATKEEVMSAMAFVAKLGEIQRAIKHRFEEAAIQWIDKNGEIEDGVKRWYVGTQTTRKCLNTQATARAILKVSGGDMEPLLLALSTSCFKPATAMEILGQRAPEFFETIVAKDLKTGAPKRKLKGVDPARLKGQTDDEPESE